MQWEQLQQQWQQRKDAAATLPEIRTLLQADHALQARVRKRDRIELIAAVVVVVAFGARAVFSLLNHAWLIGALEACIVVYGICVPLRLRQARRAGNGPSEDATVLERLRCRHHAALAQARMLERAWLWYVLPPMVGITALTLVDVGPTPAAIAYLAVVYLFGIVIAWFNRRTARKRFRRHAADLQNMIAALADP